FMIAGNKFLSSNELLDRDRSRPHFINKSGSIEKALHRPPVADVEKHGRVTAIVRRLHDGSKDPHQIPGIVRLNTNQSTALAQRAVAHTDVCGPVFKSLEIAIRLAAF